MIGQPGVSGSGLTVVLAQVAEDVRRELVWRFDTSLQTGLPFEAKDVVKHSALRLGLELSSFEIDAILSHLETDWQPFGPLQPLVDDKSVTDIIVSSYCKVAVQQNRRNLRTSISFPDARSYEAFVERLLAKAGTSCTTKQPIADGMVGPFARVHAVHSSLCEEGPYLTIRINRFSAVATSDLVAMGVAPEPVFNYLRAAVGIGRTVLVVGEVGTGKTTVARALASSIPDEESLLVIEDTPEIRLQHPHVRYVTTRSENAEGEGRVTPAQCIRAGMRMAMNRIIFGEIRDAEAAEAFIDVCTSGHPGLSTLHARTSLDAVTRLELLLGRAQRGVGRDVLTGQIAAAVHVIALADLCPVTRRRRLMEIREIGPVADGVLRSREIFTYHYAHGAPQWTVGNRVSAFREELESLPYEVKLSALPPVLELPLEAAYHESRSIARRAA